MKKRLKVGRRVAVIVFNFEKNEGELKRGTIIAIRYYSHMCETKYAVKFDDGEIKVYGLGDIYQDFIK